MKKQLISALVLACGMLQAQEAPKNIFISPFDFPLYLSGNFGELRSNHFHGGVDFKTEGVEGKPVRCIADGYVSRITVSSGGYGNALYVTHTNGYTSVHGHLKAFADSIAEYVEKYQYEKETFVVDLKPDSTLFLFKQGQVMAWSGNTGYSFGPHLHLEIRETKTNELIDPLVFYRDKLKDTRAPIVKSVMIYPQRGKGVVNGKWSKQAFAIAAPKGKHCLSVPIEAWGEIGVGIKANDYMNGVSNVYGVRSVTLYVDSVKVYNSTIDRYSFDENRMLNSWTDFEEFKRYKSWYIKSFAAPGNTLRALHTDKNRGIVCLNEERAYHFLYVLQDLHGNTSKYTFVVRGNRQEISAWLPDKKHDLKWDKTNVVQEPGMQLTIPKGMLYEDVALNCKVLCDSNAIAFDYQLHDVPVPLHTNCELMIGVRNLPVEDTDKYYVVCKVGKAKHCVGGTYEDGWMKTSIRELGTYTVAIDTIAPKLTPLNRSSWARGIVSYQMKDHGTGVKTYKGKIDGQFALFAFSAKNGVLSCRIDPRRVKKGGTHTLEVSVEDYSGNVTTVKDRFVY